MNDFEAVSVVIGAGFLTTIMTTSRYTFQLMYAFPKLRRRTRAYTIAWSVRVLMDLATNGVLLGLMWHFKNLKHGSWALLVCIWLNMLEQVIVFFQAGYKLFTSLFSPAGWNMTEANSRAALAVVFAILLGSSLLLPSQLLPPGKISATLSALACIGHCTLTVAGFHILRKFKPVELLFSQISTIILVITLSSVSIGFDQRIHQQIILASALIIAKFIPIAVEVIWMGLLPNMAKFYSVIKRTLRLRREMVENPSEVCLVPMAKGKEEERRGHGSTI